MGTRELLLEAALRRLAESGPEALQARKLAAEIGASTMAVYTHFGNMTGLVQAIAAEGYDRFAAHLSAVPRTGDPVADLTAMGLAYRDFALANAHLYGVMFGTTEPGGHRLRAPDLTEADPLFLAGKEAFSLLVAAVERAGETGRLEGESAVEVAAQIWSVAHGYCLLELAGYFGPDGEGVRSVLLPLCRKLLVGSGDAPEAARASVERAAND
ncbi:TetR-like C-terminal domain-containing protein [Actinocorallia longicatena]|uniref:TetR/AcrR family transcriptional regulator n=1 Tax=Actinocorallia longicatena TaxID=111803 RepID=A0ABP6Q0A0_9ACTN